MNRTSEVETAMQLAQTGDASPVEITIAAYVERLEKENFTLRWEPAKLKARAEAAEQRVKKLEAELIIANTHVDDLTPLIAQNAKLRAVLENELAANLRAEATIRGTTRAKFVLPQQERLKAALAEAEGSTP